MNLNENYLEFVAIIIGSMVLGTVLVCVLQVYCKKYFGINFCPGEGAVLSNSGRLARIRAMEERQQAMETQSQLETQQRDKALEKRRKERISKYKALLKDNTMTVTAKDLVHNGSLPHEDRDIETGGCTEACNHDGDHLLLDLPQDKDGKAVRVAGHCSVCIAEYTPGDKVVWATGKRCPHAFHEECILTWLSKGKKRCPVCRNTFAPSAVLNHSSKDMSEDDDEESEASSRGATGAPENTHHEDIEALSDTSIGTSTGTATATN